jgi:transcriptional regulator with XRE-family HTH domain/CheY-like chemotaxis protein
MVERRPRSGAPFESSFEEGLGRAIRVLRTGQDLSRGELAERAEISYSYLSEIENGAKSPSSRVLAALAEALGLPVHDLLEAAETWRRPSVEHAEAPPEREETLSMAPRDAGLSAGAPLPEEDFSEDEPDFSTFLGAPAEEPEPALGARASLVEAMRNEALSIRRFARPAPPSEAPALPAGEVPPALVDEIQAGNCVAFVGAGFSAAAKLPAWGELLKQVAAGSGVSPATRKHVAERVARGSASALDEAAQVLEDQLGRDQLLGQLQGLLGHPRVTGAMARRVGWLCGIPFRSILTTNFDGILRGATPDHQAYRQALRPEAHRWWEPRYWGAAEGAYTLKLHGDLAQPSQVGDSVVLAHRDYRRRLYEDPAYETFLRAIMSTTTVLYLGFSFEDAYLNELRSEILALLGQRQESAPVAYAIVNDVPTATRRHFRRHEGIEILSYDSQGGRDFSGFDAYLRSLYEATNPLLRFAGYLERRRILWVDPHPENNELAFQHLAQAARVSGREGTALVTVASADQGLRALERAGAAEPFDLVITHWGEDAASDDDGRPTPAALRLLTGIRTRDLRCPVVIFAASGNAERRKRMALGLGAQAYCFSFETLYRTIERVLAPAEETG